MIVLIQFYSAIIESVLCTSITVWFSSATKSDKNCNYPEWAKGLAKSLWTPHIQHTPSLNCYRLVDATELWAPEQPDTETVYFPKQSISCTIDIIALLLHYLTLLYNYLFTTHTYNFFSFQICTCQTSHIIVCILYCVSDILYIVQIVMFKHIMIF